ncbi:MAG: hypothetical protein JWR26_2549 [Pedosphaera sp.]|nr:hypothetical protein [Pedosphaera sp.]
MQSLVVQKRNMEYPGPLYSFSGGRRSYLFRIVVFLSLVIAYSNNCAPGQTVPPGAASAAAAARTNIKAQCYAAVGPLLRVSDGKLTPEVRAAYLDWARGTVLEELRLGNQTVSEDCLTEVRADPALCEAIFGAVFPPDPSILQNFARLRADMGKGFSKKYRSLAVATAVAKRVKGVQANGDFGRDYQTGFWVSESLQSLNTEAEKALVGGLADFMKANQVSAIDLYEKPSSQRQLAVFLKQRNIAPALIAQIKKSVQFGERLKNAMVILGQRPAARDPNPDTTTWLRHLVSIYEATPSSTPTLDGKVLPWPIFPITEAPWPLLMPLARSVPLNEANFVWEAFQGQHGSDRYHTYGPYRGDEDAMPDELQPSPWFWDAWPDRLVHGGMCVPLSKATTDFYLSLGEPAVWAGQPGHANLIAFKWAHGSWNAQIEQAFAGGPDVTFAQWYFDEDPGTALRFRDLYNWAGSEYHLGLALAMNSGLQSYIDTRLAANIFAALPPREKPTMGVKVLRQALETNPFNPEIWYRLAKEMPNPISGLAVAQESMKHGPGGDEYWRTVEGNVVRYAIFSYPIPDRVEDVRSIYAFLESASGALERRLSPDALRYNLALANKGDAEGQFLMGKRYRDWDGVPKNYANAVDFFARSAAKGNKDAAHAWDELTAFVPMNLITVTVSSQYSSEQAARHLVDRSGMRDDFHDNNGSAQTMWTTVSKPALKPPSDGLPPSPAWARFDFAQPQKLDAIQIWNQNQAKLSNRGFRRTRICGSSDNINWFPMTSPESIRLPRANGNPGLGSVTITNSALGQTIKSVIIAAEPVDGNYGSDIYGLSAVRFMVHRDNLR